jgi:hypothetical protein
VTITRTGGAAYTYLNAVVIEEVDASVILLNPQHLHAEPVDKTSIALTWTDRTNNEQATGGYELQRATDSLFTANVTNIPLAANTTEYTDQGLKANTKYWYRVRAKNGADVSEYSNKYNAVTPESIVYINFNFPDLVSVLQKFSMASLRLAQTPEIIQAWCRIMCLHQISG